MSTDPPPADVVSRTGGEQCTEPSRVRVSPRLTVLAGMRERQPAKGGPPVGALTSRRASSTRSAAIMATGTTLSRLSGFARVLAVAWALGQGSLSDAYNQANTVPNTIYELLLGGVLSATLLPVLMQSLGRYGWATDDDTVPAVTTFLTVFLVGTTMIFWLAAPLVIDFYFLAKHGGSGTAAEKALATEWLRLFAPQLLFMGLITLATALLNARRRFGAVAFSPILANFVTIVALVVADHLVPHGTVSSYQQHTSAIAVVGIGTTAGYLAQLLALVPALVRSGAPLSPRWYPRHPALVKIVRLSGWTLGAVLANQVSFALVTILFLVSGGSYSAFSYAYAFVLLPHAVLAVSIAYAVAPDLAEMWSSGEAAKFGARTAAALRVTAALVVPAGAGYALVAGPVVLLALAHGNFAVGSAHLTANLLRIFAIGLPGFSLYLLLMRAFQSKQDTRSMFWLYLLENGITVAAAAALYPVYGARGLTAAWIGSYTLTLPFAWRRLRKSANFSIPVVWWARLLAATAGMAAVTWAALHLVPVPASTALSAVRLCVVVGAGAGAFALSARLLGITELNGLWARSPFARPVVR